MLHFSHPTIHDKTCLPFYDASDTLVSINATYLVVTTFEGDTPPAPRRRSLGPPPPHTHTHTPPTFTVGFFPTYLMHWSCPQKSSKTMFSAGKFRTTHSCHAMLSCSHQRDSLNEREDGTGTNVTNPTTTRTATPTVVANQTASTSDVSSWLPEDAIMQPLPRPRMSQPLPAVDTSEPEPIHPTKCTQHTRRAQQTPRTKFVQWIEWARWDKWTKWAGWTGRSKCRVGHALELLDCENGGHVNVTSAAAAEGAAGGKRAGLKRLDTPLFQQYRNAVTKGVEREGLDLEGRSGRVPVRAWNKMAIVRIHRPKKEPKVR